MSELLTFNYQLAALALPPTSLLLLALFGVWLAGRWRAVGLWLTSLCLLTLLALSTPVVAFALLRTLETPPLPNSRAAADAQAIVILAGGISHGAPDYGGETMTVFTLQRVRYGAILAKETRLPVLVTGGSPTGGSAEAALMRDALVREYGVPVRWVDDRSQDTRQNAINSAALLKPAGVRHIVLVTSALHMPRALRAFAGTGLKVTPAPTGYFGQGPFRWEQLVPSGDGLRLSFIALREWLAIVAYKART